MREIDWAMLWEVPLRHNGCCVILVVCALSFPVLCGFSSAQGPTQTNKAASRAQVRFLKPSGMKITWLIEGPKGKSVFSTVPLEVPGRFNFIQGAIYQLRFTHIQGHEGVTLYPTLEVVPQQGRGKEFLQHNAATVAFTDDDFQQVVKGNFLVKVIYLPDPRFQDVAGPGIDHIVSTQLEPGADPIMEARRRGTILLVIRMGNRDLEAPNGAG